MEYQTGKREWEDIELWEIKLTADEHFVWPLKPEVLVQVYKVFLDFQVKVEELEFFEHEFILGFDHRCNADWDILEAIDFIRNYANKSITLYTGLKNIEGWDEHGNWVEEEGDDGFYAYDGTWAW